MLGSANTALAPQGYALNVGAERIQTCQSQYEPHKVSSVFPSGGDDNVVACIEAFMGRSGAHELGGNAYISFHGMGGKAITPPPEGTAFPWRDMHYLMQIQAWWGTKDLEAEYLKWVKEFRGELKDCTDRGFIAFPDADDTVDWYYDGGTLGELSAIKGIYDPDEVMKFAQSIPPG